MISINEVIVVEGKYDKIKLSSIIDAVIIPTNGFKIFKDKETLKIIRYYAATTGIIILTDSDTAGFKIRSFLKGAIRNGNITNVYIPDIFGKEKRKSEPSKEGKLGVEGIEKTLILDAFAKAGIVSEERPENPDPITRIDFYECGFSGMPNSSTMRKKLLSELDLPELMSSTAIIDILNTLMSKQEFFALAEKIHNGEEPTDNP